MQFMGDAQSLGRQGTSGKSAEQGEEGDDEVDHGIEAHPLIVGNDRCYHASDEDVDNSQEKVGEESQNKEPQDLGRERNGDPPDYAG